MKNLILIFSLILLIFSSNIVLAEDTNSNLNAGHQSNVTKGRLLWSGINWRVYTQMENSTWVDDQGLLHMRLQKIGDRWYGTELNSPTTYLYGKFIWNVSSTSLQFERNTSIGMFTYTDDDHEIDIEINQWPGLDPHLWFVNQPGTLGKRPDNVHYSVYSNSSYLGATNITYMFDWEPTYINYSAISSDGTIISNWNLTNASSVPHVDATIIEVITTVRGKAPLSGQSKEIVFNSFQYIPSDSVTVPNVDFSVYPIWGTAPLPVTFTDKSTGSPTSWFWDFGDGTNSTERNPIHNYTAPGIYTTSLTVSNTNGTLTRYAAITVIEKAAPVLPIANFSTNISEGYAPISVQFTDLSKNVTSWNWDFGDGTYSYEKNPLHTYNATGTYTVKLTATNSAGMDTETKINCISVTSAPLKLAAAFTALPTSGNAPLKVVFTDESTGSPTSWNWDFGDGTYSTARNPVHTFSKTGKYTIGLTVKNAAGNNKATRSSYITVAAPLKAPVAAFSASPTSGNAPLKVIFTDKSTGSPTSWKWSFGDGTYSYEKNPVHTYSKVGKYTVSLTVKNAAGNNSLTKYKSINVTSFKVTK